MNGSSVHSLTITGDGLATPTIRSRRCQTGRLLLFTFYVKQSLHQTGSSPGQAKHWKTQSTTMLLQGAQPWAVLAGVLNSTEEQKLLGAIQARVSTPFMSHVYVKLILIAKLSSGQG